MKCKDCKWWKESEDSGGFSYCRRYAPKPFVCSSEADAIEGEANRYAKWPDTGADDWCGEFKDKVEYKPSVRGVTFE